MDDKNIPSIPLISFIHRRHASYLNEEMKEFNITYGQYPYLMELCSKYGRTQEEIAKKLHLEVSTVARTLEKLENKELVIRERDFKDKRKNYVYLTEKGEDITKKIGFFDENWDEICSKNLKKEEFENFKEVLMKICKTLNADEF